MQSGVSSTLIFLLPAALSPFPEAYDAPPDLSPTPQSSSEPQPSSWSTHFLSLWPTRQINDKSDSKLFESFIQQFDLQQFVGCEHILKSVLFDGFKSFMVCDPSKSLTSRFHRLLIILHQDTLTNAHTRFCKPILDVPNLDVPNQSVNKNCYEGVQFDSFDEFMQKYLIDTSCRSHDFVVVTGIVPYPTLPRQFLDSRYSITNTIIWFPDQRKVTNQLKEWISTLQDRQVDQPPFAHLASALAPACLPPHGGLPDLRIGHLAELASLITLINDLNSYRLHKQKTQKRKHHSKNQKQERWLEEWNDFIDCDVIAYCFMPKKSKRMHVRNVFDSTSDIPLAVFFVPIFPFLPIAAQVQSLSVPPKIFLFKVSDYLGTLPLFESQIAINYLLEYFSLTPTSSKPPLPFPTSFVTPSLTSSPQLTEQPQQSPGFEHLLPEIPKPIKLLSSLECQHLLLDRFRFLELLDHIALKINSETSSSSTATLLIAPSICLSLPLPNSQQLEQMLQVKQLKFPLLSKLRLGGGPPAAHLVASLYSVDGLYAFAKHVFGDAKDQSATTDDPLSHSKIGDVRNGTAAPTSSFTSHHASSPALDCRSIPESLRHLSIPPGLILQEYIEHAGDIVFKVFVIGKLIHIKTQASILNLERLRTVEEFSLSCGHKVQVTTGNDFAALNSSSLKSNGKMCDITLQIKDEQGLEFERVWDENQSEAEPEGEFGSQTSESGVDSKSSLLSQLDLTVLCRTSVLLIQYLGTPLLGYDVLMQRSASCCTEKIKDRHSAEDHAKAPARPTLVLVDANYLPSYSGVANLPFKFRELILEQLLLAADCS